MAHIFKKKTNTKGILVYTHKELEHGRWHDDISQGIPLLHQDIVDNYYIGIHHGSVPRSFHNVDSRISFAMASPGQTATEMSPPRVQIPMNSRNFLPDFFKPTAGEKMWDVLNISRNIPLKRLDVFMRAVRELYDQKKFLKVLLVVPSEYDELNNPSSWPQIMNYYENNFSAKERDLFTFIKLSPEYSGQGISLSTIAHFYKSSRVFTLLSAIEGESRVIHEALACGLPIVCFSGLSGGGRDYLNDLNSVQFDDYEDLASTLETAVNNTSQGLLTVNTDDIRQNMCCEKTLPTFITYINRLYALDGSSVSQQELINTDYLHLRLPSHFLDVPWYDKEVYKYGADILTNKQCLALRKELNL